MNTPLHLFWAGTEAVYLFFVLSGLVLAFSLRSSSFHWSSYFPSRFARLYLPVFGAVLLGRSGDGLHPRGWSGGQHLGAAAPRRLRPSRVSSSTSRSSAARRDRITPLWSLQWEVIFSALLPLYIYASRRMHVALQLVIFFALATLGTYAGIASLKFLPMLGIGVALASLWDGLSDRLARLPRRRAAVLWLSALVVAVLMVTSFWTMRKTLPAELVQVVTLPLILAGICVIIVAAANAPILSQVLSSRVSASSA